MICVIPFCKADHTSALRLVEWIKRLGGCPNHHVLFVADYDVNWSDAMEVVKLAKLTFKASRLIPTEKSCDFPWPLSANLMFTTAAKNVSQPFFWLEPDAVPLKAKWLETLETEYNACGKPFMGPIMMSHEANLPKHYMAGTAVYPANAIKIIEPTLNGRAWDVDSANVVVPQAAHTELIHHLWGEKDRPPIFAEQNIPSTNVFCLKQINPKAVVFHRNKDGSLINLLSGNTNQLMVVYPFCAKDQGMAEKNMRWMEQLCGQQPFDLVMIYDQTATNVQAIEQVAQRAFKSVQRYKYNCPNMGWPQAPNFAFQTAARTMTRFNRPWLWLEPDAIPVKRDWLTVLQKEYLRAGRRFMGAVVPIMGHMNGVGIYPPNTPNIIPRGMRATSGAWDTDMRDEMIDKCHDAGHLIQHCWGIQNGCAHPFSGDSPHFRNNHDLQRWLMRDTVLFHRCKDGSLIDQLSK